LTIPKGYTPGPWKVRFPDEDGDLFEIMTRGVHGRTVCDTAEEADAHLLALAPEMAEALASALAALDEATKALEYAGRTLAALGSPETRLTPIRAVLARIDAIREAETKRPAECVSPRCSIILDPGEACPVCAGVREAETP
jgi:hypothetical protein